MRTIGLNKMRSIRELIFKCLLLSLVFSGGCRGWKWTNFDYFNRSEDREIYVSVIGIDPNPSPGYVIPNDINIMTPDASSSFGDPVRFDDIIKIEWTVGEDTKKHEQEFRREDLGIPSVVSGGKITFTYTQIGNWEISYSK